MPNGEGMAPTEAGAARHAAGRAQTAAGLAQAAAENNTKRLELLEARVTSLEGFRSQHTHGRGELEMPEALDEAIVDYSKCPCAERVSSLERRLFTLDQNLAAYDEADILEERVAVLEASFDNMAEQALSALGQIARLPPQARVGGAPTGLAVSEAEGTLEVTWDRVPGLEKRETWDLTDPKDRARARAFVERMADSPARTDALERIAAYERPEETCKCLSPEVKAGETSCSKCGLPL